MSRELGWLEREERARRYHEKQLEERRKKLLEQRQKEEKRRHAVEEKRRIGLKAEKVRVPRGSSPKNRNYIFFFFPVVLFIHLHCLGVTCQVAIEISAVS